MIYLTGDTHGGIDVRKLLDKKFLKRVKEGDYLIICGDFGFIWDYKKEKRKEKEWLDFFNNQKYTTFDAVSSKTVEWWKNSCYP